jgi:iron complex transport system substrate-binding protein
MTGCVPSSQSPEPTLPANPKRVVSLDYCADQFVLQFMDRENILALSTDAEKEYAYLKQQASGIKQVRAIAEDVLTLQPDLVVRSYGGGPNMQRFLASAGVPTLQVGWASKVDGSEEGSVAAITQSMADGLGQTARGARLVNDYLTRLKALPNLSVGSPVTAMYMTPAGFTTGPGSLVHDMMTHAGLSNFESVTGWRPLPLERLAYESPDMVAAAFFDTNLSDLALWSASRHPVAKTLMQNTNTVFLPGAWTTCGGWFIADAMEALAAGIERVQP